jgi:ribosomal protein S18 acetylase RimI-like enzyme
MEKFHFVPVQSLHAPCRYNARMEPLAINISRAALADLPAVVDLCMSVEAQHEAYWPLRWKTRPGIREGYLRWLTKRLDEPRMLILAAKVTPTPDAPPMVAGALLATIETEIPIYTYTEYAFIHDMAVAAEHRRRGIAKALLAHARDWTKQMGLNQLRLMVAQQNLEAQITFDHFGFRKTYQEMVLPLQE